ncbi:antibiotic biosynthesis monooxygenase [Actinobaculum suis]|uniref:Antibiotic biosynthesis monooxygenase n=1 Tax=Actinobaculum suis TaxID=1657 RepID=A0A7Z8Y8W9_9ACTO|nr:antibiotic biosynthesis monooxygenase [Actinobaculum suis]VDG76467.1 antibiotic biosynthesis monooxygenase [Actinobaculum suis]
MTFVNICALSYPQGAEKMIEERFAHRAEMVDTMEGFWAFKLMRPVEGENRYYVVTEWESEEAFNKYMEWRDTRPDPAKQPQNTGMEITLMNFETVEDTEVAGK